VTEIDWASLKQTADDATRPAPAGDYDVIVKKAEAVIASTGAPMIKMQMGIEGGPSHGKIIFNNLVLTVDNAFALSMWFRNLAAFGVTDAVFAQNPSVDQIAAMLVGRAAVAKLSIRQFQGQDRNQVDQFSPPAGGPQVAPMVSNVPAPNGAPVTSGPPVPRVQAGPPTPYAAPPTPTQRPLTVPTPEVHTQVPGLPAAPPPDLPF
jgi:hypothetical protein